MLIGYSRFAGRRHAESYCQYFHFFNIWVYLAARLCYGGLENYRGDKIVLYDGD